MFYQIKKNLTKQNLGTYASYLLLFVFEVIELIAYFWIAYVLRKTLSVYFPVVPFDTVMYANFSMFWLNNWWIIGVFVAIFMFKKLWFINQTFWYEWEQIIKAVIMSFIISFAGISLLKSQDVASRLFVVIYTLIVLFAFPFVRYFIKILLHKIKVFRSSFWFVGEKDKYKDLKHILDTNKYLGIYLQYFMESCIKTETISLKQAQDCAEKILQVLNKHNIRSVIVQTKYLGIPAIDLLAEILISKGVEVMLFPEYMGYKIHGAQVYHLMYENYFLVRIPKGLFSIWAQIYKTIFDYVVGVIVFIVASPLLLLTALLTFIGDGLPIIYPSDRYGKHGKLFKFYKFRYMIKSTSFNPEFEKQELEKLFKRRPDLKKDWDEYKKLPLDEDFRLIPRTGKLLAISNLQELAQIFNVLKGQMSLVGPRPYLPREREDIGDYFDRIFAIKPGITGLWQVLGGNKRTFKERLEIDTWYIRNWSIWLDFVILFKTIKAVADKVFEKLR